MRLSPSQSTCTLVTLMKLFEDSPLVHSRCRERVQNVACAECSVQSPSLHARQDTCLSRLQRVLHSLPIGERLHHDGARVHVLRQT